MFVAPARAGATSTNDQRGEIAGLELVADGGDHDPVVRRNDRHLARGERGDDFAHALDAFALAVLRLCRAQIRAVAAQQQRKNAEQSWAEDPVAANGEHRFLQSSTGRAGAGRFCVFQ